MSIITDSTVDVESLNQEMTDLSAGERIAHIFEKWGTEAVASTSFGLQSAVMLHLISEHAPQMPIVFVDTGYNFPETYRYIDTLLERFPDLNLQFYGAQRSAAQQEARWGKLWEQGPDGLEQYSIMNKVEPMNRALTDLNAKAWLSGLRRSQSKTRANRPFIEQQSAMIKGYPILDWVDAQVEVYMNRFDLPLHPLATKGYVTMGDWHSTKPLDEGEDAESTRFGGEKYECGLHTDNGRSDFQI